ncbi:methylated-DNA--[protein]-cysteine S-methyltransferase [Planococcus sp. ISL-109]|uniref:methylated-DNA--[protein]-cysteine S-methyltransferase n=1 Tax=Planococcus sp. ISL-109 TaxID=2819166 RepID=UPI002035386A|nr:methylated-DNA--[protein]-cysteine S-methyltransferase [Planococcus sp. ISL-109]
MTETIHWAYAAQCDFRLAIASTKRGLCYVGSPGEGFEELERYCQKRFPEAEFIHDPEALKDYKESLEALLMGSPERFSLPFDTEGTDFQRAIWQALQKIPHGQTISYSELAASVGKPQAVRATGSAVGANPLLIFVPCHRVIRKSGDVTGFRGGMPLKHHLLEMEQR